MWGGGHDGGTGRAAHHAEVQEITELLVRAHGRHPLWLVHSPEATGGKGPGAGVGSSGLETALQGARSGCKKR